MLQDHEQTSAIDFAAGVQFSVDAWKLFGPYPLPRTLLASYGLLLSQGFPRLAQVTVGVTRPPGLEPSADDFVDSGNGQSGAQSGVWTRTPTDPYVTPRSTCDSAQPEKSYVRCIAGSFEMDRIKGCQALSKNEGLVFCTIMTL